MEECMDQEAIVQYDPNGQSSDNVTRAAQQLSRTQGGHIVLSTATSWLPSLAAQLRVQGRAS